MANFLCVNKECGQIKIVAEYTFTKEGDQLVYKNKWKEKITCTNCKSDMLPEEKEPFEYVPPTFGQPFSSKSPETRKRIMKDRSKQHSQRNRTKE